MVDIQPESPAAPPHFQAFSLKEERGGGKIKGEANLFIAAGNQFTRRRRNSSREKGGQKRGKNHGQTLKEIADYPGIHYTGGSRGITNIVLSNS